MAGTSLDVRIEELEQRLVRVESRLGIAPPSLDAPGARQETSPPAHATPWRSEAKPRDTLRLPALAPVPFLPPARPRSGADLEQTIGLKLAGRVGAIVVVIAAAFGIKFAVDQGWFGALPPAARLALMSLAGLGLIGLGEIVYRRLGALASAALFGAGVATLFVVSYAGHAYYRLYPRDAAFVMMGLATLVGAGVALRGNLVSIAVLALVGGNVAPLVLADSAPRLVPFLSYLLMLQAVALGLSAIGREGKWWALRGLSFFTLVLWVTMLLLAHPADARAFGPVMWFVLTYAVLFQAELVYSAARRPVGAGTPENTGATFSALVTGALALALLCLFWHEPRVVRGGGTLLLAAACGTLGLLLAPGPASNTTDERPPGTGLHGLSLGFRFQAVALWMAAVPVTLSGVWVSLAWGAFALAFGELGAALDLAAARRAAVGVWWLSVLYLAVWSFSPPGWWGGGPSPYATLLNVLGQPIPTWAAVAALLAVVGHAVAALVHENWTRTKLAAPAMKAPVEGGALDYESRAALPAVAGAAPHLAPLSHLVAIAADVVWLAAALLALRPLGATAALLTGAIALLAMGRFTRAASAPSWHGAVMLALAAIKWLTFDTIHRRLLPAWSPAEYPVLLNTSVAVAVALLAAIASLRRLRPAGEQLPSHWAGLERTMHFAAVLIVLWAGAFEIDRFFQAEAAVRPAAFADALRAEQVALSVWGSLYAVACVSLGFRLRAAPLRYFGLGLFAVALLKVFLVDLNNVGTGYRVLSLLGLGTLLIGTSLLYAKLSPILLARPQYDAAGTRALT